MSDMVRLLLVGVVALCSLLGGCATHTLTVDDGSPVDPATMKLVTSYGAGERALRQAIVRSSDLRDSECEKQWELPFAVASSADLDKKDRIAWVRGLGVDERLTVIATTARTTLKLGDKMVRIAGFQDESAEKMVNRLAEVRDLGKRFEVQLASGSKASVEPFQVCRGYARLAPPSAPTTQDYHWLMSMHPLQVAQVDLTEDEALWAVLWGQGVSEEGGARMKTYHYGMQIAGTLYNIFTIATGLKGAAMAANLAVNAAQEAAKRAATEALKKQLMEQATQFATNRIRDEVISTAQDVVKRMTQKQVMDALQQAAANRGALMGVARVASTVFEKADAWAFARMKTLRADPLAAASLHQKLIERSLTANSMVFDPPRLDGITKLAEFHGLSQALVDVLQGFKPEDLQLALLAMPLASDMAEFSYDMPSENEPFARGLIDASLDMPIASGGDNQRNKK